MIAKYVCVSKKTPLTKTHRQNEKIKSNMTGPGHERLIPKGINLSKKGPSYSEGTSSVWEQAHWGA